MLAVLAAEIVAFFVCPRLGEPGGRTEILCARLVVAGATLGAYRGVHALFQDPQWVWAILAALTAAGEVTRPE